MAGGARHRRALSAGPPPGEAGAAAVGTIASKTRGGLVATGFVALAWAASYAGMGTEKWWPAWTRGDGGGFRSPHVLHAGTSDFGHLLADAQRRGLPMLVAFYDPASQSFGELRPHLDDSADAIAQHALAGRPVGILAACDASLHSYLGVREAPEMLTRWQGGELGPFEFGRPTYFPVVLVHYQDGARHAEYTGAVDQRHVVAYLERHHAPIGGTRLATASALRDFLAGHGPFALACGLKEHMLEHAAFDGAARELHGRLIFGWAASDHCEACLGVDARSSAKVAWVRGDGSAAYSDRSDQIGGNLRRGGSNVRVAPEGVALASATTLAAWLTSHRPEVLETMTPDNSHVYFSRPGPLAMLLVDPSDIAAHARSTELFADVEQELLQNEFQLAWSDCRLFGSQFDAELECPVVVLFNTRTADWRKKKIAALQHPGDETVEDPWRIGNGSASGRLLMWLRATSVLLQSEGGLGAAPVVDAPGVGDQTMESAEQHDASKESELGREEDDAAFEDQLPPLGAGHSVPVLLETFHALLLHLIHLRGNFRARYGDLRFDFSDVDRAQELDSCMRALAVDADEVRTIVESKARLRRLFQEAEGRERLRFGLDGEADALQRKLLSGYEMLGVVFVRLFRFLHAQAASGTLAAPRKSSGALTVERREASGLSTSEFLERYARPGRPVIITGLSIAMDSPWTLSFFRERCNATVRLLRRSLRRRGWGRLEHAADMPFSEFVDTFRENATRRQWYLHDWSLPKGCPAAFGPPPYRGFTVPKYFAGDYLQRAPFERDQHTWPSLFVGSSETESAMHVDSGGTNFWLYLLSGRKEWRFLRKSDIINAYKDPIEKHFHADIFNPDFAKHPLMQYAEMTVGVQEAGELMFVPGEVPHGVRNLQDIHGVSMNYVDATNLWSYLWHAILEQNWRSFELFANSAVVPRGLRADQQPISFGEWKSTPWRSLAYDIQ